MNPAVVNIHATVIVAGTLGLAFVGPSGSGKSSLAFTCLADARREGKYAALVGDDRVDVSLHGNRIVASRPAIIADLIELRHAGIVGVESQRSAVVDAAILPVGTDADRLPEESEVYELIPGITVPLLRVPLHAAAPLAFLETLIRVRRDEFTPNGLVF